MVLLRFLAHRRFNYVDLVGIGVMASMINTGHPVIGVAAFVAGLFISVTVEQAAS